MTDSKMVGTDDYLPTQLVYMNGQGSNVSLSDFAIIGGLAYRNDSEANDGIGESFGKGSKIRNIWVEHTKVGSWNVNSHGLLIEGCRFRNTTADGINLSVATISNTSVVNPKTGGRQNNSPPRST